MAKGYLRPSILSDVRSVSERMREMDVRELEALQQTPKDSLNQGMLQSKDCQTIVIDDSAEAMFGISKTSEGGLIWFLCTDEITKVRFQLIKQGRAWVDEQVQNYGLLYNYVLEIHEEAQAFIAMMGFEFTHRVVIYGKDFLRFERN